MLELAVQPGHFMAPPLRMGRKVQSRKKVSLAPRPVQQSVVLPPNALFKERDDIMSYAGILRGAWGKTPEETDTILNALRSEWTR